MKPFQTWHGVARRAKTAEAFAFRNMKHSLRSYYEKMKKWEFAACNTYLASLLSGKNFRAVKGWKVLLGLANSCLAAFQGFFGQAIRLPAETDFASRYHEYGWSAPSFPTWTHAEIWAKSKVRNCFHAVKCLQYRSPPDLLTIFSKRYRGMKLKSWE